MKKFQLYWVFALLLISSVSIAQTTIEGKISDQTGPLPGVNILEKGTSNGTTSDFDGNFSLTVKDGKGILEVSFVGMGKKDIPYNAQGEKINLGTITLSADENVLEEVVVTGTIDIAKDRETPVAVSTIKAVDIQNRLGNQEFPEILATTPSVYATKQGGGFGDSRINIRGFDQANTAVMINGQPVNDMENGWVYWSNWAGLSDVTTAMQVQRGLGSSKLAISSVGGTINVVTQTSAAREGGTLASTFGNDGYMKFLGAYNTGLLENGFSASVLLSNTSGDGYVDGTKFQGSNYFLGFGYKINEKHDLQFIFTGAPQWHHQKSQAPSIADHQKYQPGGIDLEATEPNRKYNSDWGYLDGEEYSMVRNFYHKPVMSLNWEWVMSDASRLSTVLYASWGRGGGTGEIGVINSKRSYQLPKTDQGLIRFDDIKAWNSGQSVPDFGVDRTTFDGAFYNSGNSGHPASLGGGGSKGTDNGITRRASMNSHNWYGSIINFNHEINENFTFDVGVDLRTYEGLHYRVVNNDLGADGYIDYDDINNPNGNVITQEDFVSASPSWNPWEDIDSQEKIDYHNDGLVNWIGVFGQLEYKNDNISAFVQGSFSNQGFERVDYFLYTPEEQKSGNENITGGNIKGGINYNINENHNVFFNTGYYSKQPKFDAVYINFSNTVNPDLTNEKIFGMELGYGYRSAKLNANANLYRTSWADRFESRTVTLFPKTPEEFRGTANYTGITQVHTGIEVDFSYKVLDNLSLRGMASFGNWEYDGNSKADLYDESQVYQGSSELFLDGVKVGDAAQTTASLGADYNFYKGFTLGVNWRYAGNLYANINAPDFTNEGSESLELPSYNLFDARLAYNWLFDKGSALEFAVNVDNIFDELYISESDTNIFTNDTDTEWEGINTKNRVFFGFGTTWNASVRYRF